MSSSVREYAILYVGGRRTGSATLGGGNAILLAEPHALGGPEHTGQLPIERISTAEIDTALVAAPDGLGGVAFRAEESGAGVPYYIGPGETFLVPEFIQALFSETIDVDPDGDLVVDGMLIEVD